jgi:hypothetical protein
MWSSAAGELKDLPNVIIEPHNEPVAGDGNDWSTAKNSYFSNLQSCVNTIRSAGFNGLIVYQWDYGTWVNMDWPDSDPMSANAWSGTLNWVALFPISDPLGNLVISTHQYWDMGQVGMWTASHGGSDSNPTYPTSIADIKLALSYEGLQYVLNTLNKPIIIGELGWNKAWTDQSQMQLVFTNQLQAYNDLGINYTAFWFRSEGIYSLISSDSNPQPNLAGQILINKIAEP